MPGSVITVALNENEYLRRDRERENESKKKKFSEYKSNAIKLVNSSGTNYSHHGH